VIVQWKNGRKVPWRDLLRTAGITSAQYMLHIMHGLITSGQLKNIRAMTGFEIALEDESERNGIHDNVGRSTLRSLRRGSRPG
jgi:hypothetical protein